MRFLKPISLLLVSILFLASCGYRPSAYYAKQELGKELLMMGREIPRILRRSLENFIN
jgi:hypothetical protein